MSAVNAVRAAFIAGWAAALSSARNAALDEAGFARSNGERQGAERLAKVTQWLRAFEAMRPEPPSVTVDAWERSQAASADTDPPPAPYVKAQCAGSMTVGGRPCYFDALECSAYCAGHQGDPRGPCDVAALAADQRGRAELEALSYHELRARAEHHGLLSRNRLVRLVAQHETAQAAQIAALQEGLSALGPTAAEVCS